MKQIRIEQLTVGAMQENCYLVSDTKTGTAIIIDPGDDAGYISDHILSAQISPVCILATHGHFDHIMAALELQLMFNIPFRIHEADTFLLKRMTQTANHFLGNHIVEQPPTVTAPLIDGEKILFGEQDLTAIAVPGHTPGSLAFYHKQEDVIFTGDVLFRGGSIGRTDFEYCDSEALRRSVSSIIAMPADTVIYPGHGETTTAGEEAVYSL